MVKRDYYITEQQVEALEAVKRRTGLPIAEIVRRALDEYMERHRYEEGKD